MNSYKVTYNYSDGPNSIVEIKAANGEKAVKKALKCYGDAPKLIVQVQYNMFFLYFKRNGNIIKNIYDIPSPNVTSKKAVEAQNANNTDVSSSLNVYIFRYQGGFNVNELRIKSNSLDEAVNSYLNVNGDRWPIKQIYLMVDGKRKLINKSEWEKLCADPATKDEHEEKCNIIQTHHEAPQFNTYKFEYNPDNPGEYAIIPFRFDQEAHDCCDTKFPQSPRIKIYRLEADNSWKMIYDIPRKNGVSKLLDFRIQYWRGNEFNLEDISALSIDEALRQFINTHDDCSRIMMFLEQDNDYIPVYESYENTPPDQPSQTAAPQASSDQYIICYQNTFGNISEERVRRFSVYEMLRRFHKHHGERDTIQQIYWLVDGERKMIDEKEWKNSDQYIVASQYQNHEIAQNESESEDICTTIWGIIISIPVFGILGFLYLLLGILGFCIIYMIFCSIFIFFGAKPPFL